MPLLYADKFGFSKYYGCFTYLLPSYADYLLLNMTVFALKSSAAS